MEPPAAVTISDINKIHGTIVFASPLLGFDVPDLRVDQHQASRTQQRDHSPVAQPNVPVTMPLVFFCQRAFKMSPSLYHSGKKIRASRIESRIESQRHSQPARRRGHMGSRNLEI